MKISTKMNLQMQGTTSGVSRILFILCLSLFALFISTNVSQAQADIGVTEWVSQNPACGLSNAEYITIRVANSGPGSASAFNVGYDIVTPTGTQSFAYIFFATIPAGSFYNYTFFVPADMSEVGYTYNCTAWVTFAGDANVTNDTLVTDIFNTPSPQLAIAELGSIDCFGETNDGIDLTITRDVVPNVNNPGTYTISWSNSETTEDLGPVNAGTYSVYVIDENNCDENASITITQPGTSAITASISVNSSYNGFDISCNGAADGIINSSVMNGTAPFSYLWSDGSSLENATGLVAGPYNVTITDVNNCSDEADVEITLTEPTVLSSSSDLSNYNGANISCDGGNDGTATINPDGGTGSYTIEWQAGETDFAIGSLVAGNYTYTITDISASTCTFAGDVTLASPTPVVLNAVTPSDYDGNGVSCFGASDGEFTVDATGGTGALEYSMDNTNWQSSNIFTGLSANVDYDFYVQDINNCQDNTVASLTEPAVLEVQNFTTTNCFTTIAVSATGGSTPYSYLWSNDSTTQTIDDLTAGWYYITINDNQNCEVVDSFELQAQPVLVPTLTPTLYNGFEISCIGASDGAIDLELSGGLAPYTYLWNGGSTEEDINGLNAGTYDVSITDADLCETTGSVTLNEPTALSSSFELSDYNGADISCEGGSDGTATITPAGGTGDYTIEWGAGETSFLVISLAEGTYYYTITDISDAACTYNDSVTLVDPVVLTINSIPYLMYEGTHGVSCNGASDGEITVNPAGGTGTLEYSTDNINWQSDSIFTGLSAGINYNFHVRDLNNCLASSGAILTEPNELVVQGFTTTDCFTTIEIAATGGSTPYSYLWSNSEVTKIINGLTADWYFATITDNQNCVVVDSFELQAQPVLVATLTPTLYNGFEISCLGASDGQIDLEITGGLTPYIYSWSNSETTEDISGLVAGTYDVTITDVDLCETTGSVLLNEPTALTHSVAGIDPSCATYTDGSATITPGGGTSDYLYEWSNGATDATNSNLGVGTYAYTVTDLSDVGCFVTGDVTLTEPDAIVVDLYAIKGPTCTGEANAIITANLSGGVSPYSYLWSDMSGIMPNETELTVDSLYAGNYAISVTDANGCIIVEPIEISDPNAVEVDFVLQDFSGYNLHCYGDADGQIVADPSGGAVSLSYTLLWEDAIGTNLGSTDTLKDLVAGMYYITVTDYLQCVGTDSVTLTQPDSLSTNIIVSSNYNGHHISCNGASDGSVDLQVFGGIAPYGYSWSEGSSVEDISGLSAGTYSVTVTDFSGCGIEGATGSAFSWYIPANSGSDHTLLIIENASVTIDGLPLSVGDYIGVFYDSLGTLACGGYSMFDGTPLQVVAWGVDVGNDGFVAGEEFNWKIWRASDGVEMDAIATYGAFPFNSNTFSDGGLSTISAIAASSPPMPTNSITSITLIEPDVLSFTSDIANVSCNGLSDGSVELSPDGGTGDYLILWDNSETTFEITNLLAGTYNFTITDDNNSTGCTLVDAIIVEEPTVLDANPTATASSCYGLSDGTLLINELSLGGTSPYSYLWSNGSIIANPTGVAAGNYSVTVTDDNGCTDIASIEVSQPPIITVTLDPSSFNGYEIDCNGNSTGTIEAIADGGIGMGIVGNYTYTWEGNAETSNLLSNLAAGTYTVTVSDAIPCQMVETITLTEPTAFSGNAVATTDYNGYNISCFGAVDGAIDLSVSGGVTPYEYIWSDNSTIEDLNNIEGGFYIVTVTDANNCELTTNVSVDQPQEISINDNTTDVYCFAGTNGEIDITVSGGVPSFTFLWSNGSTTEDISNITAGTYQLDVTDINGCQANHSVTISESAELVSTISATNVTCNGLATGAADLEMSGGVSPYNYTWSNSAITQDIANLIAGTYYVTITDNYACVLEDSIIIIEYDTIVINAFAYDLHNGLGVSCFGGSDGSAVALVSGGSGSFTYTWTNEGGDTIREESGTTSDTLLNLGTGVYNIAVEDNFGCSSSSSGPAGDVVPWEFNFTNASLSHVIMIPENSSPTVNGSPIQAGDYVGVFFDSTLAGGEDTLICVGYVEWSGTQQNISAYPADNGFAGFNIDGSDSIIWKVWRPYVGEFAATVQYLFMPPIAVDVDGFFHTQGLSALSSLDATSDQDVSISTVIITQPDDLVTTAYVSSNYSGFDVSCFGDEDGEAEVTITGGISPYTYSWGDFSTNTNYPNLDIGVEYFVTITDANNCTSTSSITLNNEPSAIGTTPTTSDFNGYEISCNGELNGTIQLATIGGTGIFTYEWSNGSTIYNPIDLGADTYSVTITDENSCQFTTSVTLTEPDLFEADAIVDQAISCYSYSDGSVDLTLSGGVTNTPVFIWSNSAITEDISNLVADTYSVTVTDDNGCIANESITVTQPGEFIADLSIVNNITCFGETDGEISVSVTGGTPSFSYNWSGGTSDNLAAGTYSIDVTDNNSCIVTSNDVTIIEPAELSTSINAPLNYNNEFHTYCNETDATIDLTVNGGTAGFAYIWTGMSNGNSFSATTEDIANLGVGTFYLTVTDSENCTILDTIDITAPGATNLLIDSITNYNGWAVSCNGASDGSLELTYDAVPGSTYNVIWSITAPDNAVLADVPAGEYYAVVMDNHGCISSSEFMTIHQPEAIDATQAFITHVGCNGDSTGSIGLIDNVTGGTMPYNYYWTSNQNGNTTDSLIGIGAGTYFVIVEDVNFCVTTGTYVINEPDVIDISFNSTSLTCYSDQNGTITPTVIGGTAPYTYLWDDNNSTTSEILSGIGGGTYSVTVTDANNCTLTGSEMINSPNPFVIFKSVIPVSCNGNSTGSIDNTVSGGTAPYTFEWSTGETTEDLGNLVAGTYTVTITDANQCDSIEIYFIDQPLAITVSLNGTTTANCGASNGTADISVTNGFAPLSYLWSDGSTDEDLSNALAGMYSVTVTDITNCTGVLTNIEIQNNAGPSVVLETATTNDQLTCPGDNDGNIDISVPGSFSYTYIWSTGATTQDVDNLSVGIYTATVSDNNPYGSCMTIFSHEIIEPDALSLSVSATDITCNDLDNGEIDLTVSGGTTPYTFAWSNSEVTEDIVGLPADTYTVTVSFGNGMGTCADTESATITNPDIIAVTNTAISNVNCFGATTGAIDLTTTGGTGNLSFVWSNAEVTEDINGLVAGTYTVTITDENNCEFVDSYIVTEEGEIIITTSSPSSICTSSNNGEIDIDITGGVAPYTFLWSNGEITEDIAGLGPDTYTVTLTDFNSCEKVETFVITNNPPPTVAISNITNISCFGGNDGAVTIYVDNGTPPYSFNWSNGETTQNISGLDANVYTVNITDDAGCTAAQYVVLAEADEIQLSLNVTNVACAGNTDGAMDLDATGGTGTLSYLWSNGESTQDISNLDAGTYSVTVTDGNSCSVIESAEIIEDNLVIAEDITDVNCFGLLNGSINITVSGGIAPYTYLWSNGAVTEDIMNVAGGDYSVVVTDASNCIVNSALYTVNEPLALSLSIVTDNGCFDGDGSAELTVNGGTAPYNYSWGGFGTGFAAYTQNVDGLDMGIYFVFVTDAHGCGPIIGSTNIGQWTEATVEVSADGLICDGGVFTFDAGAGYDSYLWSNGEITQTIDVTVAGTYTVTVDDAGCTAIDDGVLSVDPSYNIIDDVAICEGEVHNWQSVDYSVTGTYTESFTTVDGCDSIHTLNLTVNPVYDYIEDYVICEGDVYNWQGTDYSVASTFTAPYQTIDGCDSIYTLNLTVNPVFTYTEDYEMCNGETYNWQGTDYTASGIYTADYITVEGCDSIYTLNLTVNPVYSFTEDYVMCDGEVYNWQGTDYAVTGIYTANYSTLNSCDSNYTLNLTVNPVYSQIFDVAICEGESYFAEGAEQTVSDTYTDVLQTLDGCDSTIITNLTVNSVYEITNNIAICDGESFLAGGMEQTITGVYYDSLLSMDGCDSVIITDLVVNALPVVYLGVDTTICDGNMVTLDAGVFSAYNWSTGETTQTIDVTANDAYWVQVTDANSCMNNDAIWVYVYDIDPYVITTDASCMDFNGSIHIGASSQFYPITYTWNNYPDSMNNSMSNLQTGTYNLTIEDSRGCIGTESIFLNATNLPEISYTSTAVSCFGGADGSIDVTLNNENTPATQTYAWDYNSEITEDLTGLSAGTYNLTVSDNGCFATISVEITQPASEFAATVESTDITCYGMNDGTVTLNVDGGTLPYTYTWSNGASESALTGLIEGAYTVTISEANNCNSDIVETFTFTEPDALSLSAEIDSLECYDVIDGGIDITVAGGTTPYRYYWDNSELTEDLMNIGGGDYTVTVVDTNGCSISASYNVASPNALDVISSVSDVTVNGGSDGSFHITLPGFTTYPNGYQLVGIYDYVLSDGTTLNAAGEDQTFTGLAAGNYTLTITAWPYMCVTVLNFTIDEPGVLQITSEIITDVNCYKGADGEIDITVTGGVTPYTFLWKKGAITVGTDEDLTTLTSLTGEVKAGMYKVYVTDDNGTSIDELYSIGQPASAVSVAYLSSDVSCFGDSDGSIDLTVSGGTPGYTFLWSNSSTDEDLSNLTAASYNVLITDANSCDVDETIVISSPTQLNVSLSSSDIACNGDDNGYVISSASGGTAPYTYLWTTTSTDPYLFSLSGGNYELTVTDNNGCSLVDDADISEPDALGISFIIVDESGLDAYDGSAEAVVTGGTIPYLYAWDTYSSPLNPLTSITAGNHTVTVTDANSCVETGVASVFTTVPPPIQVALFETEQEDLNINVYPNPNNSGLFNLELGESLLQNTQIQVLDGLGKVIYDQKLINFNNTIVEIDITDVRAGVYFLRIISADHEISYKKLIISK